MGKALILANVIFTLVNQSYGAPIVDLCGGRTREGDSWHGRAIHLSPWRKNSYGDRAEGKALCIGMLRRKTGEPC